MSKSDAVLPSQSLSPVQHQGQQFVLGEVNHRLGTQVMHAGTSLTLEQQVHIEVLDIDPGVCLASQ